MTDHMLPIIRQMHDADSHGRRAEILLECPLMILMKYRDVFEKVCEQTGFQAGTEYLLFLSVAVRQTRFRGNIKGAGLSHATGQLLAIVDGGRP